MACSLAALPPQIYRRNRQAFVAKFAADGLASDGILCVLCGGEQFRARTTGGRRLPAGQCLIPALSLVMP